MRADDPSLTGHAGPLLTGELVARTHLIEQLDQAIDAVRPFKQRRRGQPRVVFSFTVVDGKIATVDLLADPERLAGLELEFLDA